MKINGLTIADEGTTKQYIPDTVGGWLYEVTTTVWVQQKPLAAVQQDIDRARGTIATAQALLDVLEPKAAVLKDAQAVADTPIE